MMATLGQGIAVMSTLLVGASVGVLLMGGSPVGHEKAAFATSQGPEFAEQALKASILAADLGVKRQSGSEVKLYGTMRGRKVEEVVFRSQECTSMLRLGWESADHLVVSVPQYSQDAGKAAGEGDPYFLCGARTHGVRVTCDTYPVGLR